ncbi:MAG: orotate phosphoribosyltransferase [Alphaproteobacteria bacterium]
MVQFALRQDSESNAGSIELDELRELVATRSLITGGDIKLASGRQSSHYFNMKETTFDPSGAKLIGDLIMNELGYDFPDFIAGLEMGALPVVMAAVMRNRDTEKSIQGFCVRKAAKEHGTKRQIEKELTPGCKVVVVDDVTTTGGSVLMAVDAIRAEGGKVDTVITVVDRQEGAREKLKAAGIKLIALLEASEFDLYPS